MPKNSAANASKKKKSKGPIPAHQNKFAFRHNPKSKTTEKILSSPNVHVCRRCHDKIEWRKQYRKYKPLTQPSKCNICSQKNVKAAYHSICAKCSQHSTKAKALLAEWNSDHQEWLEHGNNNDKNNDTQHFQEDNNCHDRLQNERLIEEEEDENPEQDDQPEVEQGLEEHGHQFKLSNEENAVEASEQQIEAEEEEEEEEDEAASTSTPETLEGQLGEDAQTQLPDHKQSRLRIAGEPRTFVRVCAMCVKEPALPASDDEGDSDDDETTKSLQTLSLRHRKRLERQEAEPKRSRARASSSANPPEESITSTTTDKNHNLQIPGRNDEDDNDNREDQAVSNAPRQSHAQSNKNSRMDEDDDDDDPFLRAVGGASNLVTGEAYQKKRLAELQALQPKED
ncbi:hypothetical protein ACA910_013171 [Epithemia clementina (nom. ined.)]